ncbi:MAG: hypothetical protein U1F57_06880 [bacterium]
MKNAFVISVFLLTFLFGSASMANPLFNTGGLTVGKDSINFGRVEEYAESNSLAKTLEETGTVKAAATFGECEVYPGADGDVVYGCNATGNVMNALCGDNGSASYKMILVKEKGPGTSAKGWAVKGASYPYIGLSGSAFAKMGDSCNEKECVKKTLPIVVVGVCSGPK